MTDKEKAGLPPLPDGVQKPCHFFRNSSLLAVGLLLADAVYLRISEGPEPDNEHFRLVSEWGVNLLTLLFAGIFICGIILCCRRRMDSGYLVGLSIILFYVWLSIIFLHFPPLD